MQSGLPYPSQASDRALSHTNSLLPLRGFCRRKQGVAAYSCYKLRAIDLGKKWNHPNDFQLAEWQVSIAPIEMPCLGCSFDSVRESLPPVVGLPQQTSGFERKQPCVSRKETSQKLSAQTTPSNITIEVECERIFGRSQGKQVQAGGTHFIIHSFKGYIPREADTGFAKSTMDRRIQPKLGLHFFHRGPGANRWRILLRTRYLSSFSGRKVSRVKKH